MRLMQKILYIVCNQMTHATVHYAVYNVHLKPNNVALALQQAGLGLDLASMDLALEG